MPKPAPTVCAYCRGVHQHGERCDKARQANRARNARHDAKRKNSSARGYNREWERARKDYLAAYGSCRRCGKPATVVDHIKPHKGDDRLFWDRSNWQPLCAPCHNGAKQSSERRNMKKEI